MQEKLVKLYFWYILRKARCFGGAHWCFIECQSRAYIMGTDISKEFWCCHMKKLVQIFPKFHYRFQKTRQNCKQRLFEKICILYGCFEVPMYQDYVCTACSIFVLVVLCRSIVYARTSWTYRYSIETLLYVYRVIPSWYQNYVTVTLIFYFYYGTLGLRSTIIKVVKNNKKRLKCVSFNKEIIWPA